MVKAKHATYRVKGAFPLSTSPTNHLIIQVVSESPSGFTQLSPSPDQTALICPTTSLCGLRYVSTIELIILHYCCHCNNAACWKEYLLSFRGVSAFWVSLWILLQVTLWNHIVRIVFTWKTLLLGCRQQFKFSDLYVTQISPVWPWWV